MIHIILWSYSNIVASQLIIYVTTNIKQQKNSQRRAQYSTTIRTHEQERNSTPLPGHNTQVHAKTNLRLRMMWKWWLHRTYICCKFLYNDTLVCYEWQCVCRVVAIDTLFIILGNILQQPHGIVSHKHFMFCRLAWWFLHGQKAWFVKLRDRIKLSSN